MKDARVRMRRALPMLGAHHVRRVGEQQPQRRVFLPRRQQTADVVEMQVRQHHHVDALVGQPDRSQRIEQHVAIPATLFRRKGACV